MPCCEEQPQQRGCYNKLVSSLFEVCRERPISSLSDQRGEHWFPESWNWIVQSGNMIIFWATWSVSAFTMTPGIVWKVKLMFWSSFCEFTTTPVEIYTWEFSSKLWWSKVKPIQKWNRKKMSLKRNTCSQIMHMRNLEQNWVKRIQTARQSWDKVFLLLRTEYEQWKGLDSQTILAQCHPFPFVNFWVIDGFSVESLLWETNRIVCSCRNATSLH